ncbi:cell wall-binding repeat-containing protein [Microaerobacter geothermalis]|uniref:cell wall-binding repeat-containing protein n=1 Tax=Microaerobacter geothermalis TaxID=674972 RepID=UPI001F4299E0|nr:cell wall-binding repeat-containing protein [Microaerobacter geothermalis]MCF6092540.1 cell wall-binding repeat-containing protein [Microaerobacter geothermalis]
MSSNTVDTTRILAHDAYSFAVSVTQLVYPNPEVPWRPSAIILAPVSQFHDSLTATSLVHFPINAPVLYSSSSHLTPITLGEIKRLSPMGKDLPAQIFLVGNFSSQVIKALEEEGWKTQHLNGSNFYETAVKVAIYRQEVVPSASKEGRTSVLLVSATSPLVSLPASYYAAHMGVPILYVNKDSIPPATARFLQMKKGINYTLFGGESIISTKVEEQIKALTTGKIFRVTGNNPYEISVNLSKKTSHGGELGWGRNMPGRGDAFTFGSTASWQEVIAGCILAHLGKHTPLLMVEKNRVPAVTKKYLRFLNPLKIGHPEPPYMHGFILGGYEQFFFSTQVQLETLLIQREKD